MLSIQIQNLRKEYNGQLALDLQELSLEPGSITGIVGNNGAGKTTLFRLMLDLIEPTHGGILVDGREVAGSDHWKPLIGSYLDEGFLVDFLRPEELFLFTARLYGMDARRVEERLGHFEAFMQAEVMGQNKYIRNLSSGNRQKVGIVAAMLPEPRLLLLDEPFNYLDPSSQILMKRLLKEDNQRRQSSILVSSHNLNHLTEICHRVILLEKGRVIKDLRPPDDDLGEVERYFSSQAGQDTPPLS